MNKQIKYHHLMGVGYNQDGVFVDTLMSFTSADCNKVILLDFIHKSSELRFNVNTFMIHIRIANLDFIHLKTQSPLDRSTIEKYIQSITKIKLRELIKESSCLMKVQDKKSLSCLMRITQ